MESLAQPLSRRGITWFVALQCLSTAAQLTLLPPSTTAPFTWLPTALAFLFFVNASRRQWVLLSALFFAVQTLAFLLMDDSRIPLAFGSGIAHTTTLLVGALLVQPHVTPHNQRDLGSMMRTLGTFALVSIPVGASVGASAHWWLAQEDWIRVFWHWWGGDLSAVVFVVLPCLAVDRIEIDKIRHMPLPYAGWSVIFGLFSALALAWIPFPFPYVALPLGIAAFRFGAFRISLICNFTFLVCGFLFMFGWIRMPTAYATDGAQGLFAAGVATFLGAFLIGMLADQMRSLRDRARETDQRLRDALALSGTGYAIVNLDLSIREANQYLCELIGGTHDQIVGKTIQMVSLPQDVEPANARLAKLMSGETTSYSIDRELVRLDGVHVWARVTVAKPASFKDTFFLQIHDITGDRQVRAALEAAKSAAEESTRAKTEFVTNMSHEIRTPLNGIVGLSEILTRSELSNEAHETARMIRRSGQALSRVIHSILDFSRLETGDVALEPSDFELDDLTSTISGTMASASAKKRLVLAIMVQPDVPRYLRGDSVRLQQVLVNLVGNAVKFTDNGEVQLGIERDPLRDGRLRFSVRDSGIGMDPSLASRLFVPFTQCDSSLTRRHDGTGLGLAISRQLVELMGGVLEFETCPGVGTEFRFSIPLETIPHGKSQIAASCPHPFLVVEPNRTLATSIELAFRRLGWPYQILSSIPKVRDILRRGEFSGEIWSGILVDADLPGVDILRRVAQDREIPVVGMDHAFRDDAPSDSESFPVQKLLLWPVTEAAVREVLEPLLLEPVSSSPATEAPRPVPIRILVVEDNTINQVVATGILNKMGIETKVAEHGLQAVDILRDDPKFDLVLMDIQMPVMDGYTATRAIHNDLGLTLPIVAMTAGVLPRDRAQCVEFGLDDFLPKPFDFNDMVFILERNLKRKLV
ncbi:MAG: ATP-binding protein [Fibrobacterota bacterium]